MAEQSTVKLRNALLELNDRGKELMLRWTAVDVRRKARSLLNKRGINGKGKRTLSRPGQPPRKVRGTLRDLVLYSINRGKSEAIIGPKHLSGRKAYRESTPHVLESGGVVQLRRTVRQRNSAVKWHYHSKEAMKRAVNSASFKQYVERNSVIKTMSYTIRPRPYMIRALKYILGEEQLNKRYNRALKASLTKR